MKHSKKQTELISSLGGCDYESKLPRCFSTPPKPTDEIRKVEVARLVSLQLSVLTASLAPTPNAKEIAKPAIQLYFQVLKDTIKNVMDKSSDKARKKSDNAQLLILGIEKIFIGFLSKDWPTTTQGVMDGIKSIISLTNETNGQDRIKRFQKVAKLVSAIGLYAQTYQSRPTTKNQVETLQKERQQIIENLIQATVNRSGRERGWIVSLGGTLGLNLGARLGNSKNNKDILLTSSDPFPLTFGSPVSLTLGMALQGFMTNGWGFHLQLNIFDIGQYLQFEESTINVSTPEVQQAITFSAIVGVWWGRPEIPLVAGIHLGVSPFLGAGRSNAFYFGLLLGLYVPIFDF